MKCQICSSEKLHKFLSLGHQPVPDVFLTKEQLNGPEAYYPLDVYFCENCALVQLGYQVDPNILFKEYHYNTGTNESLRRNFKQLVELLVKKFVNLRYQIFQILSLARENGKVVGITEIIFHFQPMLHKLVKFVHIDID